MSVPPAAVSTWRVLIADDNPDDRLEMRRLLLQGTDRRYILREASTGTATVQAVTQGPDGPPDCLLLDYYLPDQDALEVMASLIGPDGLAVCPIVVITGQTEYPQTRAVLRGGAQDYLGKDWISYPSLTRAIENASERWHMARELRATEAQLRASEAQLRLAARVARLAVAEIDYRTQRVRLSPEAAACFGQPAGTTAMSREAVHALFHPDDREELLRRIDAFHDPAGSDEFVMDHRVVLPGGEVRWHGVRKQMIREGGEPARALLAFFDITDRKAAEEALRQREHFLSRVFDVTPGVVHVYDLQSRRTVFMNRSVASVLGYSAEEIMEWGGDITADLMHPDDRPAFATHLRRVVELRDGEVADFEHRMRDRHGHWHWFHSRDTVFARDARGEPTELIGTAIEITSSKQLQSALEAREKEFRTLADNSPDILTRFDRDLRHLFVNAAVEKATGRKPEAFLGKTNRELGMPAEVCDRWDAALRGVFDSGLPTSMEFSFQAPDGPRQYNSRLVPEFGSGGGVISVLGVAHDVTDLKRTEALARREGERLKIALNAAQAGAWGWELATGEVVWSEENFALYGIENPGRPLRYEDWAGAIEPEDREPAAAEVRDTLERRKPEFRTEFRIRHPRLGTRWLLGLGRVEWGDDGRPLRMIGINVDITELKQIAQTLAEQDRHKDEFLATLAHELLNPLAPIRNGLQILRRGPDNPALIGRTLDMLDRQLDRMVRLVDDLRDIARVRSGKITLREEAVGIREVVEAAAEACRSGVDAKNHLLLVELPEAPPLVRGDATRLVQVVSNLIINAAKYSEPGCRIRVSVSATDSEVEIAVADTGVGIAPEILPTIWDMFTQVRDTLDKSQGGMGIGLSLVKKLVEMHGGSVTAQSDGVGKGSTFRVRLPRLAAAGEGRGG